MIEVCPANPNIPAARDKITPIEAANFFGLIKIILLRKGRSFEIKFLEIIARGLYLLLINALIIKSKLRRSIMIGCLNTIANADITTTCKAIALTFLS